MPSHPHALTHQLKLVLSDFLDELRKVQYCGLEDQQCDMVQNCLREIVKKADNLRPQSHWSDELKASMDNFLGEYVSWNTPEEENSSPSHREKQEKSLRRLRKGMLEAFRFGPLFATSEEIKLFDAAYDAIISLRDIKGRGDQPQGPLFKKTVQRATEKQVKLRALDQVQA